MNKGSFPSFFPLHPDFLCATTSSTQTDSLIQQKSLTVKIEIPPYNSAKKFKSSSDMDPLTSIINCLVLLLNINYTIG